MNVLQCVGLITLLLPLSEQVPELVPSDVDIEMCGPIAVKSILNEYGHHIELFTLVDEFPPENGESYSFGDLAKMLKAYGIYTFAVSVGRSRVINWEEPVLLHSSAHGPMGHFAVLYPIRQLERERRVALDQASVVLGSDSELANWRSPQILLTSVEPIAASRIDFPTSLSLVANGRGLPALVMVLAAIAVFFSNIRRRES